MGKISDALEKHQKEKLIPLENLREEKPVRLKTESSEAALVRKIRTDYKFSESLVTISAPDSAEAGDFKVLRGQILFPRDRKVPHSILVTSAFPGEGKSFIASNLAATLALSEDEHVLLVDADLRRAKVHRLFGSPNVRGLHDYLIEAKGLDELLVKTGIEKLSILTAGKVPRNPSELLSSNMMVRFLEEAKHKYKEHFVIIDSPPSQITSEVKFLSEHVDGIIFVVLAQKTPRRDISRAFDSLGRDKILGIVFNGYDQGRKGYHKYYDQYYKRK
jgi:capsular exopolysaccharide synthesis family protein